MDYRPIKYSVLAVVALTSLGGRTDGWAASVPAPPFVQPAVAYQPRGFSPLSESSTLTREQIVDDLRLLKSSGFRSLVTYNARGLLAAVPRLARQEGFDGAIIMGIWDPSSAEEWDNAVAQARFVDGYCVGNEGLDIRYRADDVAARMAELRRLTGRPVTTSEPIDSYVAGPHRDWLLTHSDWLFPLAHPFWAEQFTPEKAVNWLIARHDYLMAKTGKKIILKEAGLPSRGVSGTSEDVQLAFFQALEPTGISFYYFEAFDQPWKAKERGQEAEAHWGLYQADGTPKKVLSWFATYWAE